MLSSRFHWVFLVLQKGISSLNVFYFDGCYQFWNLRPLVDPDFSRNLLRVFRRQWPVKNLFRSCQLVCSLWFQASCESLDSWGGRGGYTQLQLEFPSQVYGGHYCSSFTVKWTAAKWTVLQVRCWNFLFSVIFLGAVRCNFGKLLFVHFQSEGGVKSCVKMAKQTLTTKGCSYLLQVADKCTYALQLAFSLKMCVPWCECRMYPCTSPCTQGRYKEELHLSPVLIMWAS